MMRETISQNNTWNEDLFWQIVIEFLTFNTKSAPFNAQIVNKKKKKKEIQH